MPNLKLSVLEGNFAVSQLEPGTNVPAWALEAAGHTVQR